MQSIKCETNPEMIKQRTNGLLAYALISVLIVLIPLSVCLIAVYHSGPGGILIWAFIYTICRIFLLFGGLMLFILSVTIWKKLYGSFPYVFGAIINTLIGIVAIYLFFFHHYTREFLHDGLWNLLMGVVLIGDLLLYSIKD